MLLKVDAKALEWRVAVSLSNDQVGIDEIKANVDIHSENQKRFGLPSRLIAKTYLFRLVYGGSAYSYANDQNFKEVGKTEKQWQEVIDETYNKYKGLAKWHKGLMQSVIRNGYIRTPSGREYHYQATKKRGEMVYPRTTILNYPVNLAA